MKIVIFGANGQSGRLLTRRALDAGHTAVAVTAAGRLPVRRSRLTVAGADVHDAQSLVDVVSRRRCRAVHVGRAVHPRAIDTYSVGVRNIVAAMRETGVRRLVVVSSTGAFHYPDASIRPFSLRLFEPVITRTIGKTTYDDHRRMEAIVRDSGLDWTIVRPSGLFDLPDVTDYVAGEVDPVGGFTSRIDLADYMASLGAATRRPRHRGRLHHRRTPRRCGR